MLRNCPWNCTDYRHIIKSKFAIYNNKFILHISSKDNHIRINEVLEKYERLIELRKSKSERILVKDTILNEPEQTLAKEKSIDDKLIKLKNIRKELLGLLYSKEQKTLPKSEKDKSIKL